MIELEEIGSHVQASASREQICNTFDALKTCVPEMVKLLINSMRKPALLDWKVNEQVKSCITFVCLCQLVAGNFGLNALGNITFYMFIFCLSEGESRNS